ncbi:MAG: hypothetical protein U0792_24405 [Gemmataceae bacterium]
MDTTGWAGGGGPDHLWLYLEPEDGKAVSFRKRRLFVVAMCRRLWNVYQDERSRTAVEVAERYADGLASEDELGEAYRVANSPEVLNKPSTPLKREKQSKRPAGKGRAAQARRAKAAAETLAWHLHFAAQAAAGSAIKNDDLVYGFHHITNTLALLDEAEIYQLHSDLLKEMFWDHHPVVLDEPRVTFDPKWRSDTALSLARHIYQSRDFAQMPILADALQDAGCDNADILNHLRDPDATHVRGCWALDLVLGKE